MSSSLATLRRALAQRMQFWGGDIQNNGPGTVTSSTALTLVDTTRPEPDDEWDSAFVVLNPGATSNVVWRRVSAQGGWIQNTSTLTLTGPWPAPYTNGPPSGTPYELYKVFRPENWLQAVNYALARSYPHRHRAADFEIPQGYYTRLLDWGRLANQINTVPTPSMSLTVTEIADGAGTFQPGVYTFTYTYYNDFGETLQAPTTTLTITGNNSRVDIAALSNVPASVLGVNYYSSFQPNDATLDMMDLGPSVVLNVPQTVTNPQSAQGTPGMNINGNVYELAIPTPNPWYGVSPPSFNTTAVDFYRLHHILTRVNPGGFPEIWNDLGSRLWKPMGGTKLMLMYMPITQFNLKMVCTTQVPLLAADSDISQEPQELILAGGEAYLWRLLTKTSTIVNVNWQKLGDAAWADYNKYLGDYALETPRDIVHVPIVRAQY